MKIRLLTLNTQKLGGFLGVGGIGGVKQGLRHEKHRIIPPPPPNFYPQNGLIPY
nr:MAG TPA: hypothetical protein [Caudoviricetes sp.]